MKTKTKVWLIMAAFLIIAGIILFAAVMMQNAWDFDSLSTEKYETNSYNITDDFHSLSVNTDTADVIILPSDDGACRVECYESEGNNHRVTVSDSTLMITSAEGKSWYDNIGISFSSPKITVYLPEKEYSSLTINESTGDISVSDLVFDGDIEINVSTGETELSDILCNDLISDGSTGEVTLKNVIAEGKFYIERSTGSVKFDGADAGEIFVETDTGSITGTLLSDKVIFAETDTGKIDVPNLTTGGKCELITDTGDIKVSIK